MTREHKIKTLLPMYLLGKSGEELIYDAAAANLTSTELQDFLSNIKEHVVDRRTGRTTRLVDLGIQSIFQTPVGATMSIDDHFTMPLNNIPGQNLAYRMRDRLVREHELIENEDFSVSYKLNTASITKLKEF